MLREDAQELGCAAELEHTLQIPSGGTGAHPQIQVYQEACAAGAGAEEALRVVVDSLREETVQGV